MKKLKRSFFERSADKVAQDLLGQILVWNSHRLQISETEAYVGEHDLACHASKGRTQRTEIMFGPAGYAYIYLIYGLYQMLNVVTSKPGDAQAILIRAAESLTKPNLDLRGPGKLTKALNITKKHNGIDLCGNKFYFIENKSPQSIITTPRIGVAYAKEWAIAPLRFYDGKSSHVSLLKKLKA